MRIAPGIALFAALLTWYAHFREKDGKWYLYEIEEIDH